jgi:hypothetical protein
MSQKSVGHSVSVYITSDNDSGGVHMVCVCSCSTGDIDLCISHETVADPVGINDVPDQLSCFADTVGLCVRGSWEIEFCEFAVFQDNAVVGPVLIYVKSGGLSSVVETVENGSFGVWNSVSGEDTVDQRETDDLVVIRVSSVAGVCPKSLLDVTSRKSTPGTSMVSKV